MSISISEKVLFARSLLSQQKPYFASALWALKFVPVEGLLKMGARAAIDVHWRLYYDTEYVEQVPQKEVMGLLIHELTHLVRRHFARAKLLNINASTQQVWSIAIDLEINDDLQHDSTVARPKDQFVPSMFKLPDGLTGEDYYEQLRKQGQVNYQAQVNCGCGAHGQPAPWEQLGEGRGQVSAFEAEAIRKDVAHRIQEQKDRGTMPGGWQRWAELEVGGQVDWRRELAALLRNTVAEARGRVDYTYRYPNRRQAIYGRVIMPSMTRPLLHPAVISDTSGSMGDGDLAVCKAETLSILRSLGIREISYYAVDAAVHASKRVRSASQITFEGGGGTDMRVGIAKALGDTPRPDLIIVFTDGYTPWPNSPTPCPLVCCIIGNVTHPTPSWAKTIRVEATK